VLLLGRAGRGRGLCGPNSCVAFSLVLVGQDSLCRSATGGHADDHICTRITDQRRLT
jgi:hypothetical protein